MLNCWLKLGLDKPMWQQYLHYIWGVMHGDLGISLKSRIPVWDEFRTSL
ncbi:dipeptide transporter permease DppB [Salmonella enterica subsp. enterica]|uniref:Dipeptide transporter permease DppB n=1 Tax=Salmonella enterica I TaxID=59201 RepID=A0A379VK33_SALET|nr:dipeptide transporter permease DppB [Salmonella enterica subsp. enterica]